MILRAVREFIIKCPYLDDLALVNVDFLPSDTNTFAIEKTAGEPILERYIDGGSRRQLLFVFACRLNFSEELANNISNCGFFENFSDWLEECTEEGYLPELREGYIPEKIEAISDGYLFDVSGDLSNARYQIQCRFIYEKEC